MRKPWIRENGGRQLEGLLGAYGKATGGILTIDELIQTAAGIFEIPMQTTCQQMFDAIQKIHKAKRRELANRNIG